MAANTKYYIYNKSDSWKGLLYRLEANEQGIKPQNHLGGKFFSLANDSLENDTVWHRIRVELEQSEECHFYLSWYASNSKMLGKISDIDRFLQDEDISIAEKEETLASYYSNPVQNPFDMPLNMARGRYLWFKIEIQLCLKTLPVIKKVKLEFPLESFASYLPEIYQAESEDFLIRFLGIFQNIFIDTEEKIDTISRLFDVNCVSGEALYWLASWVGIDEPFMWPEDRLKKLIQAAWYLYPKKGTKDGLIEILELFTGERPLIVENYKLFEKEFEKETKEIYKQLYGEDIYTFTVILSEEHLPTRQHFAEVKRVVESFKPAYTYANIVVLKQDMLLDSHTYLGINTSLPLQTGIVLDEVSAIPFKALV